MFIINLLGLLFTTNLPLAILHEQSVLLRPKIIHSDAELTQMQTYAIKDLFVVLSSFTGDPNSGRLLYNIVSRQTSGPHVKEQCYQLYDNTHHFLPTLHDNAYYLRGGRLLKFFPDKAIIFTIILRHDIHYASIATDRIYYSNNMTSSLSWYALDDEYVADDLQADPNLMERLERLCSSNSCAGPSLDVINFWQSQISAVELQFNQLLTNKFALVGDVDQTHDHSELRSIDAAINAASLLLSDCNFLSTISGETINSAALDLSAELAATLRRSSMFKDLSISESTIKDTTANCKKSKKMSSGSIDKDTVSEPWSSTDEQCPEGMSLKNSLVNAESKICFGQSGLWIPSDTECMQMCNPIQISNVLSVNGGVYPEKLYQASSWSFNITCAKDHSIIPTLNTSMITKCDNGVWQPDLPVCERTCPSLNITGSSLLGNFSEGEYQSSYTWVRVSCVSNRSIDDTGNTTLDITCNKGRWFPYIPKCELICHLPVISNGILNNSNTEVSSGIEVLVTCSENFTINGSLNVQTTIQCSNNRWTPGVPQCLAKCPPFAVDQADLFGGQSVTTDMQLSTTIVNISCFSQSTVNGTTATSVLVQCKNGYWKPELPQCLKQCEGFCVPNSAINSTNGSCVPEQLSSQVLIVECNDHYSINNSTETRIYLSCNNGSWSEELPICSPMCPNANIIGSSVIGGNNPLTAWQIVNTKLTVICDRGAVFNITCDQGLWLPALPRCDVCPSDISIALDTSASKSDYAMKQVINVLKAFTLQLPVSKNDQLFNFITFSEQAKSINHFQDFSTHEQIVALLDGIQLTSSSVANVDSALSLSNDEFDINLGDRPCFQDQIIIFIGTENVMLSERSLRKLNRRNIRVSAIVLGNTTTWDSFTFDSISYVSNIDLLTIEFLNSQAVSLCVSEKYGKEYQKSEISPIANQSEMISTPLLTATEDAASLTSTTTTPCRLDEFTCASVDRFCVNYDDCYSCGECRVPTCVCSYGWWTNQSDVIIDGSLQCSTDVNECEDQPCAHNGLCSNYPGDFTCDCPYDYVGPTCEHYVGCANPAVEICTDGKTCRKHTVDGGTYGECV